MSIKLEVSRKGVDIKKASDSDKILSSDFPMLKVYEENSLQKDNPQKLIYIYHGLDYIPVIFVFQYGSLLSRWKFGPYLVDETYLYLFPDRLGVTDKINVHYLICSNKLLDTIEGKVFKSGYSGINPTTGLEKYAMEISKDDKDVKSCSLIDMSFSTKARYGPIHKQGYDLVKNGTDQWITIPHHLGYPPRHFVFVKIGYLIGYWYLGYTLYTEWSGQPAVKVDNDNLYIRQYSGMDNFNYAYIILKDPL